MAVPKKRASKARTRRRASINAKLEVANLSECDNCGAMKMPHRVCPKCGHYRGRQVLEVSSLG
ncbi:MAG: 50S ribosomal protein L32 [Spirochaetales bacterium]|nr:50S ribosomal protein L32 [Spirochaetales bacterium]